MSRRNIANYTTFNSILVNSLEIQNTGVGLTIYDTDPNNPTFSFNPTAQTFEMTGLLNVTGDATFETITVDEFEGGMQFLASTNPGDTWDIGFNGGYNDGTFKYAGIIRDASDTLKRWTFFKEITALPTTNVAGIDSTKLDSVRMNYLYVNDGTVATPSITFHNDTNNDTGFYLAAQNEIGISTGGVKIAGLKYVSGSATTMQLDSTTTLKFLKLDTIDNAVSVDNGAITIGHINLQSSSANDRWFKYYSATSAGTPAYAGTVYTSPTDHYFVTNTGGSLLIARGTDVASADSCPDYRDSTTTQLFLINGTTSTETKLPLIIPLGSLGNLALKFAGENTTGLYRSGVNSIGVVCSGTNILNITPTLITASQILNLSDGSVSAPALGFTGESGNLTGIYRPGENQIGFSTGGIAAMVLAYNSPAPQMYMQLGGTNLLPTYAFTDVNTGMYSPTDEATENHIAFTLGGDQTLRLRRRTGSVGQGLGNIEFYNSTMFTPNATNQRLAIYDLDTRVNNTLKGTTASFQAYNLIDESLLLLYTFRSTGTIGQDYSNNGISATVVGSPTVKTTERDANLVLKRDVLDFTGNTGSTQYLNLTSQLSSFTSIDQAVFSFWFKISGSLTNDNTIFDCYKTTGAKHISIKVLADGAAYPNALQVTVECDSLTTLEYHTATASDSGTPSPVSIKDGLWHHVVIFLGTSGGPNSKHLMFLDNNELTQAANKIYYTFIGDNSGQPELSTNSFNDLSFNYVSIGAFYNGTSGSLGYTGYLKDFYLTKRFLSTSEISTLYNEPTVYAYALDVAKINASDFNIVNQGFFSNGSASAPSITFTSDTDTGLYRSAANTIGFSTSGTARMTIADTILQYSSNAFEIDTAKRWLRLKMASAGTGPRLVFCHTGTPAQHSIRSNHLGGGPSVGNYLDFYLFDGSGTDADGLGNNHALRIEALAYGPNSSLFTINGISRAYNGTVSAPAYSFTNSTGLGLYRIADNDLGLSTNGILRLQVNTVVNVGNAAGDTTTKLYVPLGTQALPTYSFIGDTDTGIFSSTANNIDISCGNTLISNFSTTGQLNQEPLIIDKDSTTAFVVRKDGAPIGGDIFAIDTTNSRIGFGYTGLFISRMDSYNSTTQRLKIGTSSILTGTNGLVIYNDNTSSTNAAIAELTLGLESVIRNSASMSFYYVSNGSTNNKIQFGFSGVSGDQFNIKADGSTNVTGTFTVSSTSTFSGQIFASAGTNTAPSYSFSGVPNLGFYRENSTTMGFVSAGATSCYISSGYMGLFNQFRASTVGLYNSTSVASIGFMGDLDTGIYYISSDRFGITNGNQNTWIWDNRGTAPHECLNEIYFKPNGTNIRAYVQDKKLRLSSDQTVLNILPIIHYKFTSAPASNTSIQDESINKYVIEATTATYVTSTISLTDANGVGLLQYGAAQFNTAGTDRIETNTVVSELTYLSDYKVAIKFKATNVTSGSLFEIYGNKDGSTASNYIKVSVVSGNINILIHDGSSTTLNASSTSVPFTTNVWYNLVVSLTSGGNSMTVNGNALTLSYTTGSSSITITPSGFGSTANLTVIVGGATASILAYIAEFYIAPTTTTETASALYRTQAHEIYTNKLQIAGTQQGIVDEGYILRSDKGNNAVWDNSLQINAGYIQFNSSKVLRLPDGTAALPASSFISDPNTGMYSGGADILAFTTGGTQRATISTTQVSLDSSVNMLINNTTVPTTNSTGALIVTGGIGIGNGSSTSGRINFGSGYTITANASNRLIALFDNTNNNYQFYGFGIQTSALTYNIRDTTTDHIFFAGTSSTTQNELFRIKGTGVAQAQNGAVGGPSYSFVNSPTTGFYRIGADNIGFAAAGAKTVDLSSSVTQVVNDFQLTSGFRKNFSVVATTTLTLNTTHCIVELSYTADATNVVVTLPEALTLNAGREYTLIKTGNGGGSLVINTFDSNDFIDDNSTTQITLSTQFDRVTLICNGISRWYTM